MEEERCIKEMGANLNMICAFISKEDALSKRLKQGSDKYATNEEYRQSQIDNANNRYANDPIYRSNTIHRGKQRNIKRKPVSAPSVC